MNSPVGDGKRRDDQSGYRYVQVMHARPRIGAPLGVTGWNGLEAGGRRRPGDCRDTPERGRVVQQPVQQRAPYAGEPRRTTWDITSRGPGETEPRRTTVDIPNVPEGQGVAGAHPVSQTERRRRSGAVPTRVGTAPDRFPKALDHHRDHHQAALTRRRQRRGRPSRRARREERRARGRRRWWRSMSGRGSPTPPRAGHRR